MITWAALISATALAADPPAPSVHIDRAGRTLYLLDAATGAVRHEAPVGIGRGGLGEKQSMSDLITPTGTFTVDLIVTEGGTHDRVSDAALRRFSGDAEYAALLADLPALYANMSRLDFDADGTPDRAYGAGYIGLTSSEAVTGPKMRRYRDGTAYWYSIALHGTPAPSSLGAARSGGCVHLPEALLLSLVTEEVLTIGSAVVIADGPPPAR